MVSLPDKGLNTLFSLQDHPGYFRTSNQMLEGN